MSRFLEVADHLLGQARFIQALTATSIGVAVLAPLIVRLSGWAGLAGVLAVLVVLAAGSLWSMRLELEVRYVPITLAAFVAYAALSIVWSRYTGAAALGVLELVAFGLLGAYVALTRDISQIVRAFGGVLRLVLLGSFVIEMLLGIVLDMPLPGLGVHGNLIRLGPVQGLMGRAELMGIVAVLALVTFVVELRMRSMPLWPGLAWVAGAVAALLLSRSSTALVLALVAVAAYGALAFIRAAQPALRTSRQVAVALVGVAVGVVVYAARWPLVDLLGGTTEALYRIDVWRQVLALQRVQSQWLEGRGFVGRWNLDVAPYSEIANVQSRQVVDASSAYIDALVQVGALGFAIFLLALAAATGRSWLLASRKRSVVYVWPAVVLAVMVASGFATSIMLFELGWLLVVVCAVKASHQITWRSALDVRPPAG
ncbi:O-antigen ligase family protein [Agrococcus sp. SGAir0287]|uniref:O-antigen ligase family protein n=1 Tax=Agrococcus sp. SGAir0287 TaxID=2070347 RepID=UPI0010CCCD24|nr:O-antigen ligase family protein [Agrococcus sp. SGAir0287]QCR18675.1 exopolysaccharide biosynthesis protein [Agrococcus sp. SGAir0287]